MAAHREGAACGTYWCGVEVAMMGVRLCGLEGGVWAWGGGVRSASLEFLKMYDLAVGS